MLSKNEIREGGNQMLEKFFKLKENGTDTKTEILAGITTFMTMAYILDVYKRQQQFWRVRKEFHR